jgi:hypothetical protein
MRRRVATLVVLCGGADMENSVAGYYGAHFFKEQSGGSFEAASVIVPAHASTFQSEFGR